MKLTSFSLAVIALIAATSAIELEAGVSTPNPSACDGHDKATCVTKAWVQGTAGVGTKKCVYQESIYTGSKCAPCPVQHHVDGSKCVRD